jgi:hypothetical protein
MSFDWQTSEDHEGLRALYLRLRTDQIVYDAENCTSFEAEISRLIERADRLDELTAEELRDHIRNALRNQ